MSTAETDWEIPLQPHKKYSVKCPMCAEDRKKYITRSLVVYRDEDKMIRWQCYHPGCIWNARQWAVDPSPETVGEAWVYEYSQVDGMAVEVPNEFRGDPIWWYRDEKGNPIYAVRRQNMNGSKIYTPLGISEEGELTPIPHWPDVRGFYGQENIAGSNTILIVEGEKTRDAAQRIFPSVAAITWRGGSGNIAFGDWARQDLRKKTIYVWPDNDEPGRQVMRRITEKLEGCTVYWVNSNIFPHKADLADDLNPEAVKAAIKSAVLIQGK